MHDELRWAAGAGGRQYPFGFAARGAGRLQRLQRQAARRGEGHRDRRRVVVVMDQRIGLRLAHDSRPIAQAPSPAGTARSAAPSRPDRSAPRPPWPCRARREPPSGLPGPPGASRARKPARNRRAAGRARASPQRGRGRRRPPSTARASAAQTRDLVVECDEIPDRLGIPRRPRRSERITTRNVLEARNQDRET